MASDDFAKTVDHCTELRNQFAKRNENNDKYEATYLMNEPDYLPADSDVKKTISPDGHNAVKSVVELMASTSPKFSVPADKTKTDLIPKTDRMEKFANGLWYINGRLRGSPLELDIVHSAALFGEFAVGITSTKDLVEMAKGGSKAAIMRVERIAEQTPIVFDGPWDVRTCYPEYNNGLSFFHRKTKVKSGVILDMFGKNALAAGLKENERFEDVEYCEAVDDVMRRAWIDGNDTPLIEAEHGLPCLNIVCQVTNGSTVHEKPEEQRHAFLYAAVMSGLADRQTLALTVLFTNLFRHGVNPQMLFKALDPSRNIEIDKNLSGTIKILVGESLDPLGQQVIEKSILDLASLADQKVEDSTIYRQARGGNLADSNAAYSKVALLSQQARLPLVEIQKRCAWGMGEMMEKAFLMISDGKAGKKVQSDNGTVELTSKDIIKNSLFEVKLDVDLPQDERQNAQTAATLITQRIASKRHVREKIMGIEQSAEMEKEIAREMITDAIIQSETQAEIMKVMQKNQPQAQPGIPGQPAAVADGEIPNLNQSAQSGLPMTSPMDLQQMEGTGLPPEQTL